MNKVRRTYPFLACLLAIALMAAGPAGSTNPDQVGEIGSTVSELSLTTYDGKTITNVDMKDKVTLLVFWYAT